MSSADPSIKLPAVPAELAGRAVAAWREPVTISTYAPGQPSRYPEFLDSRVYQGSSGRIYPLPFHERIESAPHDRDWDAIHIENEYLRLMILPELGGRIHIAQDKTNGYDFFYRNNVIKPALVGLAGPWISGGVEFNWPQHHRPATYLPTDTDIEFEDDGAVTVWCSDLDPLQRMKGMHGIRIRPGSALIEARVRLYNRTEQVQTFLWWANVAARVGDNYQSFFPTDVHFVADHAKRAVTSFPAADGRYYGVDYPARIDAEHPEANRIDWYRNIPVPTSYMCMGSEDDFFGGYDHGARAGFVHVADHHISPGKKQWTWGNAPFGWAWDRNLTDSDGPYVELMAGVYTDNQPDFSFLTPGETKTFSQYWYPIQQIGIVHQATTEVAVHLDAGLNGYQIGVVTTRAFDRLTITLHAGDGEHLWSEQVAIAPGQPLVRNLPRSLTLGESAASNGKPSSRAGRPNPGTTVNSDRPILQVHDGERLLLRWQPRPTTDHIDLPPAATEPPAPADIASVDELFITGLHLDQYRHATRSPEPYWREILRRDPLDSRANVALGARRFRAGDHHAARGHFRAAIERLTTRNPNPADGEAYYRLGIVEDHLGNAKQAYDALAKAAWNSAWVAPAEVALASLDARAGRHELALHRCETALRHDADNTRARALAVICLRHLGRATQASTLLSESLRLDRLDWWLRSLAGQALTCSANTALDIALDYVWSGEDLAALNLLEAAATIARTRSIAGDVNPAALIDYHRADILHRLGREAEAAAALVAAQTVDVTNCFAGRIADADMLRRLTERAPDARALGILGQWLYAAGRHHDAIACWQQSVELNPGDPVIWRSLAIAAHNITGDRSAAAEYYRRARELAPDDAKLLYESDQLAKRRGIPPRQRLHALESRTDLVAQRDDLTCVLAELRLLAGDARGSQQLMANRCFQPWEGGEGRVLDVWEQTQSELARQALAAGDPASAVEHLRAAIDPPETLGEARHLLANSADLHLLLGDALAAAGHDDGARAAWGAAAGFVGDFQQMETMSCSELTYYSVLAARRLGDIDAEHRLLAAMRQVVAAPAEPKVDYFATSLPTMLLFTEDLSQKQAVLLGTLRGQCALLSGDLAAAESELATALQTDPDNVRLHTLLAEIRAGTTQPTPR